MRKCKSPEQLLRVTSFRLPDDVRSFLRKKADESDRTISYVLVEYIRRWINYESVEAKQPKVVK